MVDRWIEAVDSRFVWLKSVAFFCLFHVNFLVTGDMKEHFSQSEYSRVTTAQMKKQHGLPKPFSCPGQHSPRVTEFCLDFSYHTLPDPEPDADGGIYHGLFEVLLL